MEARCAKSRWLSRAGRENERDIRAAAGVLTLMRVVLVGPASQRQRARRELPESVIVIGEATTLSDGRLTARTANAHVLLVESIDEEEPFVESLTPRERQVLELVADGLSNKAVAAALDISDETVKFHLASLFGKLGASNRTDAVRRALRRGLLTI